MISLRYNFDWETKENANNQVSSTYLSHLGILSLFAISRFESHIKPLLHIGSFSKYLVFDVISQVIAYIVSMHYMYYTFFLPNQIIDFFSKLLFKLIAFHY